MKHIEAPKKNGKQLLPVEAYGIEAVSPSELRFTLALGNEATADGSSQILVDWIGWEVSSMTNLFPTVPLNTSWCSVWIVRSWNSAFYFQNKHSVQHSSQMLRIASGVYLLSWCLHLTIVARAMRKCFLANGRARSSWQNQSIYGCIRWPAEVMVAPKEWSWYQTVPLGHGWWSSDSEPIPKPIEAVTLMRYQ